MWTASFGFKSISLFYVAFQGDAALKRLSRSNNEISKASLLLHVPQLHTCLLNYFCLWNWPKVTTVCSRLLPKLTRIFPCFFEWNVFATGTYHLQLSHLQLSSLPLNNVKKVSFFLYLKHGCLHNNVHSTCSVSDKLMAKPCCYLPPPTPPPFLALLSFDALEINFKKPRLYFHFNYTVVHWLG